MRQHTWMKLSKKSLYTDGIRHICVNSSMYKPYNIFFWINFFKTSLGFTSRHSIKYPDAEEKGNSHALFYIRQKLVLNVCIINACDKGGVSFNAIKTQNSRKDVKDSLSKVVFEIWPQFGNKCCLILPEENYPALFLEHPQKCRV